MVSFLLKYWSLFNDSIKKKSNLFYLMQNNYCQKKKPKCKRKHKLYEIGTIAWNDWELSWNTETHHRPKGTLQTY